MSDCVVECRFMILLELVLVNEVFEGNMLEISFKRGIAIEELTSMVVFCLHCFNSFSANATSNSALVYRA